MVRSMLALIEKTASNYVGDSPLSLLRISKNRRRSVDTSVRAQPCLKSSVQRPRGQVKAAHAVQRSATSQIICIRPPRHVSQSVSQSVAKGFVSRYTPRVVHAMKWVLRKRVHRDSVKKLERSFSAGALRSLMMLTIIGETSLQERGVVGVKKESPTAAVFGCEIRARESPR